MNDAVLTWVKFFAGLVMFSVMFYVDAILGKTVNIYLYAIPGVLMESAFRNLPWLKK